MKSSDAPGLKESGLALSSTQFTASLMTCSHPGGSYSNEWPMLFIQHFERALGGGRRKKRAGGQPIVAGLARVLVPDQIRPGHGRWVAHQGLVLGRALLEHVVGSHGVDVGVVWGAEDNEGELDLGAAPAPQLPLHHVARHPEVHQAPIVQGVVPLRLPHLGASRCVAGEKNEAVSVSSQTS